MHKEIKFQNWIWRRMMNRS